MGTWTLTAAPRLGRAGLMLRDIARSITLARSLLSLALVAAAGIRPF